MSTLLVGGTLSLTGLGRALKSNAKVKNNIKRIDRLLSNKSLKREREKIYAIAANLVISHIKRPAIIVDWSPLPDPNCYLLRAIVPVKGRGLTIYEEVHSLKKQNNHMVHKAFLRKLKSQLPEQCQPIIITDAGFKSKFFTEVKNLDWDWLGRIRGKTTYKLAGSNEWLLCKDLHPQATKKPKFIGKILQAKNNPIDCALFIFKGKAMGRTVKGKLGTTIKGKYRKYGKSNKEPWVLATFLSGGQKIAKKVICLYKCRMQIEESFRDLKSIKTGFSLSV